MMRIYQKLVRNVFYPLILRRSGDVDELRWLREFERTQFLPADELRRLQFCRLSALLSHAHARCPFYRERFDDVGFRPEDIRALEDIQRLPILEKSDLQRHSSDMVADGWPKDDLIPNQTGGSTGTPVSFFLSHDRRRSRGAATLRHNCWAGWDIGDRVAVLWGAPLDAPRRDWRARLRRTLLREPLWLDTANVTEPRLLAFHEELKRYRPRVL